MIVCRYATKYAAKSGKYGELLNEIIEYLTQRSIDVLPPNMKQVLGHLILADCSHRAFMSKQELSYKVIGLSTVRRSFADVHVIGFYHRANLTETRKEDERTIVYSDRTEYSAYAERCRGNTTIANRKNGRPDKILTNEDCGKHEFHRICRNDQSSSWVKNRNMASRRY